jgi:chromosome segregation ATPase
MRPLLLLALLSLPAFAQKAEADQPVLQSLLTEVQQLRLAIERSTLLGTRTQLALTRLQMQESSATRLTQELYEIRRQETDLSHKKAQTAAQIKEMEDTPGSPESGHKREMEGAIRATKLELDQLTADEAAIATRESELANQFHAAQAQLAETRAQIAAMEQSLDAAIQQLIKPTKAERSGPHNPNP